MATKGYLVSSDFRFAAIPIVVTRNAPVGQTVVEDPNAPVGHFAVADHSVAGDLSVAGDRFAAATSAILLVRSGAQNVAPNAAADQIVAAPLVILSAQKSAHEALRILVEISVQSVVPSEARNVAPAAVADQIVAAPSVILSVQKPARAALHIFVESRAPDATPLPSGEFLVRNPSSEPELFLLAAVVSDHVLEILARGAVLHPSQCPEFVVLHQSDVPECRYWEFDRR